MDQQRLDLPASRLEDGAPCPELQHSEKVSSISCFTCMEHADLVETLTCKSDHSGGGVFAYDCKCKGETEE